MPVGWTSITVRNRPPGVTPTVVTVGNYLTPRKVGIIIVVIVQQSHSFSVMQRTVVPKAPRPIPADVKVGSLPREPGLQGVQSDAGTVQTVWPRLSEGTEEVGDADVYKAGPEATPAPTAVPSEVEPLDRSTRLVTSEPLPVEAKVPKARVPCIRTSKTPWPSLWSMLE